MARITGWEKLDLIDGYANIYYGETYVGQSMINSSNMEDTLDIFLGRDNKILVNRVKRKDYNEKKLIGITKKESYAYQILVKNNHSYAANIEIQDQVPVSQEEDIKVDVEDISGATKDDLNGKLTWRLNLQPGESKTLNILFSIKYPANKKVQTRKYRSVSCPSF
jgi:uncharacterized protein (TIGR02231 family)